MVADGSLLVVAARSRTMSRMVALVRCPIAFNWAGVDASTYSSSS
jgi:hypothetical protein